MADVDALRSAREPATWEEIAGQMRSDGVSSATALSARQTYWRLKRPPEPWSYGVEGGAVDKPVEKPASSGGSEGSAVDREPVAKGPRRLGRVGDGT